MRLTAAEKAEVIRLVEGSDLSVRRTLAELGVHRSTFYAWRQTGKAPRCIKLPNGEIRVRRDDLDAWLSGLEEAA